MGEVARPGLKPDAQLIIINAYLGGMGEVARPGLKH